MIALEDLNALEHPGAIEWFMQTCTAHRWCEKMANLLPFATKSALIEAASASWKEMREKDFLEAFEGHPMIGDINTLREKYASTKALASGEQAGTAEADEDTLDALYRANHAYLEKHGFIFIICASGLSAKTMLNALLVRLDNSREEELAIAANEQLKISLLRIDKAITTEDVLND